MFLVLNMPFYIYLEIQIPPSQESFFPIKTLKLCLALSLLINRGWK